MAKFCGNCGARVDDDARVCGSCGTPLNDVSRAREKTGYIDPRKKEKQRQIITKVIIVAAVVAVLVISISIVSSFVGYRGLIRKTMAAYKAYDIDRLVDLSSEAYFYSGYSDPDYYFEDVVGNDLDYFDSSVGHNYKLTYKVDETYTLSGRKLSDVLDSISWRISDDYPTSSIKKIVNADIVVTAKQGDRHTEKNVLLTMTKEGNSWRLLYINYYY